MARRSTGTIGAVPGVRIRAANDAPVRGTGALVLYWMIASRRAGWNFGLQRAAEWARELGRPLVVLEALRVGYPWASDRLHRFVLDGMAENRRRFAGTPALYHPYVEPAADRGKGLLAALAAHAAVVVTDEFPCFFLPRLVQAAAARLDVRLEAVDSCGLLPLRATERVFGAAFAFRGFLARALPEHLAAPPLADPLVALPPGLARLPPGIAARWPAADERLLAGDPGALAALPIDHAVPPVATRGGSAAAGRALDAFLRDRLPRYEAERSWPEADVTSHLSPYLHFGHLSVHAVFHALAAKEGWTPDRFRPGARRGFFGLSAPAEAWLDELVTWRELAYNYTAHRDDYARYDSLPAWARQSLALHAVDPRPQVYGLDDLAAGRTTDAFWNAAQGQLLAEGWFHNGLRILWAKRLLEWTARPEDAWAAMIELMNRYSLDGRDPNSYAGFAWTFGRYDRPWGPERPTFGKVRYVSSRSFARKLRLAGLVRRYAPGGVAAPPGGVDRG
jgi:deoxyribodipyrimidine photo-lyase